MSYKGLARKYRPSSFSELIGHDVLVKTLSNAITLNRFPQAILLTGTRGVGKTTTARIIAKSLNCLSSNKPVVISCSKCQQCLEISHGTHQDVLEIDGASHTSVQDIREILENVKYMPIYGRYKIYIIDEVHMLSNSAFNALLKTLEEPPSHVKFVFATTEVRKIPLTVISRCQRFTLHRIDTKTLIKHYTKILAQEGYKAENQAIEIIARVADGSIRDGLSMLDQAIAVTGINTPTDITDQKVIQTSVVKEIIGFAEDEMIFDILYAIANGNTLESIKIVRNLYAKSIDIGLIIQGLLTQIYELIENKIMNNDKIHKENSESMKERTEKYSNIFELADKTEMPFLLRAWQTLIDALNELKTTHCELMSLEITLVKLTHLIIYETPENLIKNLEKISNLNNFDQENIHQKAKNQQNKTSKTQFSETFIVINDLNKMLNTIAQQGDVLLYRWLSYEVGVVELNIENHHLVVYKKEINKSTESTNLPNHLVCKKLQKIYGVEWHIEESTKPTMSLVEIERIKNQSEIESVMQNQFVQDALKILESYKPKVNKIILQNEEIISVH